MKKIFDQFKRLVRRPGRTPDRNPLPAAPLTDAWRQYVAAGMTPEKLAGILREADSGDLARQSELFDQVEERDGHILGEMSKRRNVILDASFDLAPATDAPRDVKVYEDVKQMMAGITDWPDVLISLQDAVGKGLASLEMDWDVSEGQAWVDKFEFIEQKRFRFTDRNGLLTRVPLLVTDDDPMGIDIPEWRVMMHRYGGMSGHAARSGIYRLCTWWFLFKNYAVKDWVTFCDVYGMPLRLGKYDSAASKEDKKALETAIRSLGHDAAGIISKATEIEFVKEGKTTASAELYENLATFGNKEMSKAILGGTLTADVDGKGSYAAANTHNDVREDLINADARALAATVRNQFIRPYVGFNHGWDTPVPKYTGRFNKENLEAYVDLVDKLADRMDIPVAHIREKYGIPEPKDGEECLRVKSGQKEPVTASRRVVAAKSPDHPRNENLGFLGRVTDRLEEASDAVVEDWVETVRKTVARAGSLEEVRDTLFDAFPDMDTAALGAVIEKAMLAADLGGRYEAGDA